MVRSETEAVADHTAGVNLMSNLEDHDAEQAEITAACEAGICNHPECKPSTWHQEAQRICSDGIIHNDTNAERASKALQCVYPTYDDEDALGSVHDVIGDLRHLCDLMGWDFHAICDKSYALYCMEVRECGIAKDDALKAAVERDLS
jgi:hypothetical protein